MSIGDKRINELDGIKGLACICILLTHIWLLLGGCDRNRLAFSEIFWFPYERGSIAVEMFFILSGFLTAYNYSHGVAFKKFFTKKLKSLYPTYFLFTVIGLILSYLDSVLVCGVVLQKPIDVWHVFLSFSMLQTGFVEQTYHPYGGAMWFIPILIFMNVLYWINEELVHKCYRLVVYLVLIVIGWISIRYHLSIPFMNYDIGRGYMCFCVGVLLTYLYKTNINIKKVACLLFPIVIVFIIIPFCIRKSFDILLYDYRLFYDMFVLPSSIIVVKEIALVRNIFSFGVLKWLGKHSMSIYVTHVPLLCTIQITNLYFSIGLDYSKRGVIIGIMLLCIVVAKVYKHFIEERFLPKATTKIICYFKKDA